jgi:23S rRNA pseudouridine1911/1915/1917 synthase
VRRKPAELLAVNDRPLQIVNGARTYTFEAPSTGERLDRFLAAHIEGLSRSHAQHLIETGNVLVEGQRSRPAQRLHGGEIVRVDVPAPRPLELVPEPIPLTIVYEDDDMLVLDKPAGIAVHPSPGHERHTLVQALLARYPELPGINGHQRPGIVHRLDLDTSGLLMVAKTERGQVSLSAQLAARRVLKGYLALVAGSPRPAAGVIEGQIGRDPSQRQRMAVVANGRPAQTRFRIVAELGPYALLLALPLSGRTHQIRVHLAAVGHPVVGDSVYSGRVEFLDRQFLHAFALHFAKPNCGDAVECVSALPADLMAALRLLMARAGDLHPSPRISPGRERLSPVGCGLGSVPQSSFLPGWGGGVPVASAVDAQIQQMLALALRYFRQEEASGNR